MAYDMQAVVDLARKPLEDDDKDRYSDPLLLSYVIHGLEYMQLNMPHVMFGSFKTPTDMSALVVGSAFPLADQYAQPLADYAVFRASTHDADHVTSGRAEVFFKSFIGGAS